ncbi:hypothetical protein BGW80DRAFT_1317472, partial [Lactifluus volemus]
QLTSHIRFTHHVGLLYCFISALTLGATLTGVVWAADCNPRSQCVGTGNDTCQSIAIGLGVTVSTIESLNPALNSNCTHYDIATDRTFCHVNDCVDKNCENLISGHDVRNPDPRCQE